MFASSPNPHAFDKTRFRGNTSARPTLHQGDSDLGSLPSLDIFSLDIFERETIESPADHGGVSEPALADSGIDSTTRPSPQPYFLRDKAWRVRFGFGFRRQDRGTGGKALPCPSHLHFGMRQQIPHPVRSRVFRDYVETAVVMDEPDLNFTGQAVAASPSRQVGTAPGRGYCPLSLSLDLFSSRNSRSFSDASSKRVHCS